MRTIAVAVTLLTLTPVLGILAILASLVGIKYRAGGIYGRIAHAWARAACAAAGVSVRLHGKENSVPAGESGVVYCSNHVSWFDVLVLASVVDHYTFISKAELARIPIFGRAAKAIGIVFIDRANRKSAFASYEAVAREVTDGKSVIVYPEGTRGYDYRLRPFKKGPFVLAIAAGVPIVPTVVYGAREIQSKGRMTIRSGTVDVHFLEPVPTSGMVYEQREELMVKVWRRMAELLRERYGVESTAGAISTEAGAPPIPTSFF